MQIEESQRLLLSDTLVPDLFIMEHLPALSGLSVKIFVYALFCARNRRDLTEADLASRMGEEPDMIKAALAELAANELIALRDTGFTIQDIKAAEIDKNFVARHGAAPNAAAAAQKQQPVREKLALDISKTFFQGLMPRAWYDEIDSYFEHYRFEPEVVYALFQECARRNKLNSRGYIASVAKNWSSQGIVTFNDLNRYFLSKAEVTTMGNKIGRRLRRNMTEFDLEKVARWIEGFGYSYDIIEIALRKTARIANPNLDYTDRILQEWFSNQLKDVAAIEAYEKAKKARSDAERQADRTPAGRGESAGQGRRNVGNFSQRQYSEDFLNGLYESIPEPLDRGRPTEGKGGQA